MQDYWDERYKENETVYGWEPNQFFKSFLANKKPGSLLLPAEGEGRNAIYAASLGWEVDAFDFSEVAREKALSKAAERQVSINYTTNSLENFKADKQYDLIALLYVHMPPALRQHFHRELITYLKPSGQLIVEAFSQNQLTKKSGGPSDPALLFTATLLQKDFESLELISCNEIEVNLAEGPFHHGEASLVRYIGMKPVKV